MTVQDGSCELLVIGGGGSGLVAAVRARQAGARDVVVLEKTSRPGGNAMLAVVMFGLEGDPGSEEVRARIDEAFRATMEAGKWTLDYRLVRTYLETHPRVVGWLRGLGVDFAPGGFELHGKRFSVLRMPRRLGAYKTKDPSRGPGFTGSVVVETMLRECAALGVTILTRTRAKKILLDEHGKAAGVLAEGPDGDFELKAKSVIVAAGGFGANETLMREFFPHEFRHTQSINNLCTGASTGDGILMAREIGALIGEDLDPGLVGPGHHPWSYSVHEALLRPETVWVNKRGERFVDESIGLGAGAALVRQPDGVLYALLDENLKQYVKDHPSQRQVEMDGLRWLDTLDEDLRKEAGWRRRVVGIAETWAELAEFMGVKSASLEETIKRYNRFCQEARDGDFLKDPRYLHPLLTPPFYAILGLRFCHGTAGGVRVDESMRVLRQDGRVIEGLYAIGDNTSGWVTEWHLPGTTLAWAFTSGYMAGENAARYVGNRL